jgi:hypothetical protein
MTMTWPLPKIWSERRPGSWDQCTEGAYLMALVYGGFRAFPAGKYTDAERDALDAATPPDPASGGSTFALLDAGALKRYGATLHRIPDGSRAGLKAQLNSSGQAFAVAGSLGGLPEGHRLRRWQPTYTGGHAICVVSLGDGKVWWGDPLALMGGDGDLADLDRVLDFAWFPSDARVIKAGAFAAVRLRAKAAALAKQKADLEAEITALEAEIASAASATDLTALETTIKRLRRRLRTIKDKVAALAIDVEDD